MSGTVTEVTSRKLAEEALRESEQKFRFFVEQSSAGLVLTDEKGIIIEWNSAQESLTGITRGESIGRPLWEIQPKMLPDSLRPPETIQRLKQIIDLALQSGQADFLDEPMEIRLARTDGMKIFVEQTAFSIKTNQGYRLGSISHDITQLKRAEEELIASEEKYRRLVEISPIPMWINEDGIITYLNPAAMKVLGATYPEQIVGKNALDFIHPDYHTIVIERISQITDENIVVPLMEEKYIRLDGSIIDVEVTATPFFTSDTREMQVLFQDITDRKRAENERENLIQELIEKNSELERFTYTVSHDLKSPLITIAGFLGYLEKDAISGDIERLQSDTQRIQNAVNKMERLLNELLELSRIGRLMNPPKKVPIEEIIRDALENVRGQLDAHNVKVKLQPNLPNIYGDRQRLTELMQNLIDNAVKFMGAQPNPQIEIGQQGEEDGFPVFYVKDNGIGIHPKYHERVFGLFDKLDAKTEGTGIGLALVKRIVEFHGGRIWVESEAGEGSTFYFTLPVSTTPKGIPYQDLRSSRK
jgi:PAS domain S-box-containing protein